MDSQYYFAPTTMMLAKCKCLTASQVDDTAFLDKCLHTSVTLISDAASRLAGASRKRLEIHAVFLKYEVALSTRVDI